jgi:integrase
MGKRSQGGWTLRRQRNSTFWFVRFRWQGRRVERSTNQRDREAARAEAARIYAEAVSGRLTPDVRGGSSLANVAAEWILDYESNHAKGTARTAEEYARAQWLPFFGSLDRITVASIGDYMRARIRAVQRSTVRKELSALRQFLAWCKEQGVLREPPEVPSLPKSGHVGVRAKNARKRVATVLTPAEVARLLAKLPLRSARHGGWVRPFFVVLYETALRPITLYKLEAPTNYRKGARTLEITREIDKTAQLGERTLPLTDAARRELDRVCPKAGPLFEQHHWQEALAKACTEAGIDKAVSVYDLRHSRLTHLANTPGVPLTGVQYLAGHKHLSTTARYVQAQRKAAQAALRIFKRG